LQRFRLDLLFIFYVYSVFVYVLFGRQHHRVDFVIKYNKIGRPKHATDSGERLKILLKTPTQYSVSAKNKLAHCL